MRILILLFAFVSATVSAAPPKTDFPWNEWSSDVFDRAKQENKFVMLSLQAWWCHPCHQMNTITYEDKSVREYIDKHFIPIYVDQDSRPDISQRYERWGWPATVLFGPDGTEIVKLRGFYSPKFFLPILKGTVADPSPIIYRPRGGDERRTSQVTHLSDQQRSVITDFMETAWDKENGGWGTRTKFVDGPTFIYALEQAKFDKKMDRRARETVTRLIGMLDKDHGGMSQIALAMDWSNPLKEFPMFAQEAGLTTFSLAYARWGDPEFLDAANRLYHFLSTKMNAKDGGFYTSFGDAGFSPGVDKHRYARENGQAIAALVSYYDATGNTDALKLAIRNATWVLENRSLEDGGFRHNEIDTGGPFLADTLTMAHAMLKLYRSTGDRKWLNHSKAAGNFIIQNFIDDDTGGFITAAVPAQGFMKIKVKQKDDNVLATRFFNQLWYYTGNVNFRNTAESGMGFLTSEKVLDAYYFLPGVLQAEYELTNEPVHVTIVGHKDDPNAAKLYKAALSYPTVYKRAEWWDKREGDLPRDDVVYPELKTAAAFACSNSICSTPVTDPAKLAVAINRLRGN